MTPPTTDPHPCVQCGGAGDVPQVDETGEMHGWFCVRCDQKHRRRRMGWRRRFSHQVRHLFGH